MPDAAFDCGPATQRITSSYVKGQTSIINSQEQKDLKSLSKQRIPGRPLVFREHAMQFRPLDNPPIINRSEYDYFPNRG